MQDSIAGTQLVDEVATTHPLEVVQRNPDAAGFASLPKRWAVEHTDGRLLFRRRLTRDYETLSTRSEAMIHLAMTDLMARRLTGEAAISWRDPAPRMKPNS